ncbi:MAG: hypothetical protein JRN35_04855 [Nitrososphaerota archaeon]|nr:hypothetical protein [Nitrososphaerota archaeon]
MKLKEPDGCELDSRWEQIVHRAIINSGVDNHRVHPPLGDGKQGLADFKVHDVWVEVWGRDDPDYNQRRSEKTKFYEERRYSLVEFEPDDFRSAAKVQFKIGEILRKVRVKQERLPSKPSRSKGRPLSLDNFSIAESIASANGELEGFDAKRADLHTKIDSAKTVVAQLEDDLKRVEAERSAVIQKYT